MAVGMTAPTGPVRGLSVLVRAVLPPDATHAVLESGTRGRIADGSSNKSYLQTHKCESAAYDSNI